MTHLMQTNTKGFDDLVFGHRNQAYGAYVLRRDYPVNALKSLLIGVAIIASILAIPYLANLFKKEKTNYEAPTRELPPIVKIVDKEPPVVNPSNSKPPPRDPNTLGPIEIAVDVDDSLEQQIVDLPTLPGVGDPNGDPLSPDTGEIRKVGVKVGIETKVHDPIDLDKLPTFPGGEEALHKFLGENLVYPDYAKRIGIEGKVIVTFVVDEYGHVINIATPRPIGGGCDEEAARVVQIMPRWEPGIMKGYPVRVSYQLPINFRFNN